MKGKALLLGILILGTITLLSSQPVNAQILTNREAVFQDESNPTTSVNMVETIDQNLADRALKLGQSHVNFEVNTDESDIGVQVEYIPWDEYVPLDIDWPIVESYWSTEADPLTGQTHRIYYERRVSPPGYRPPEDVIKAQCTQIEEYLTTQTGGDKSLTAFDCQFEFSESQTRGSADNRVPGSNYVSNTLKSYANKYCDQGNCGLTQFWAMWRDETYWYRTGTHWTVNNAVHSWGCPATCILCSGGIFQETREYTIGTVRWQCPNNCNNSTVYGFNYTWPAGAENGAGMNPKGKVQYKTYYYGTFSKSKSTVVNWQ